MRSANNRVDIKIVIVGDVNVGKTSLLKRYVSDQFEGKLFPTVGAAFAAKEVTSNGVKRIIGIWDTAGQERYRSMAKMFYRGARAAIICYDITNKYSWDALKSWVSELREVEENCKIYLVGTKKDLVDDEIAEREVTEEKSIGYARGIQVQIFETSSKTGENICEVFKEIIDNCIAVDYELEKKNTVKLCSRQGGNGCCYLS